MNRQPAKTFPADTYASEAAAKRSAQKDRLRSDSVTLAEAAARTGASEQRLFRLANRGSALGFTVDGETLLPAWQLRASELAPVIPDVHRLAEFFPEDLAGLNAWLHRPNQGFGGVHPVEVLKSDGVGSVLPMARAIGAAGA
jgi:hypothetical protein